MKNALIFSPNFIGHRQVYVFVLVQELLKSGYKIIIAGNFSIKLNSTFYFDQLTDPDRIIRIDTSGFIGDGQGITNNEFIELQKKYNIELTIFTEADSHIPLFVSQLLFGSKRIAGRTIGIFLRPFYFYQELSLANKLRYLKQLHLKWKSDARLFHEILNPNFKLLSISLHLDDYFVSRHKKTIWLPDVFQQYADKMVVQEQSDERIWLKRLDEFKRINDGNIFLLYFGAAQQRRGYERLLKLAVDYKACFIHCGLRSKNKKDNFEADGYRGILEKENRLFETNEYLTDPVSIEYFFKSVTHIILPYIEFYGSSGVMLQALSYGIPVLVPDIGIIGHRVKKFNLGEIYGPESFEQQFLSFIKIPQDKYSKSIEEYMKLQSSERLAAVLMNAFNF